MPMVNSRSVLIAINVEVVTTTSVVFSVGFSRCRRFISMETRMHSLLAHQRERESESLY